MNFINWIKWTWQGKDGKPCSKRITATAITVAYLVGHVVFWRSKHPAVHNLYLLAMDAVFILLLFGIVTGQNLVDLKNGIRFAKDPPKRDDDLPT